MFQSIFKMMLNAERCSVLPASTVSALRTNSTCKVYHENDQSKHVEPILSQIQ
jgi:hypothetical protein